jgi:DNA-binding CsgD family transcriptional regulator
LRSQFGIENASLADNQSEKQSAAGNYRTMKTLAHPQTLLSTIEQLYRAATAASIWPDALSSLAHLCQADAVALHRLTEDGIACWPMVAAGYDEFRRQPMQHPLLHIVGFRLGSGTVLSDADLPTRSVFTDTDFHRRWMQPQGFRHCVIGVVEGFTAGMFVLELMRRDGTKSSMPAVNELLRDLLPNLGQALYLAACLGTLPPSVPNGTGPQGGPWTTDRTPPARLELVVNNDAHAPSADLASMSVETRLHMLYGLTRAEVRVAQLLAHEGLSNKMIAQRLGISVSTVSSHICHLLRKTGTNQRTELLALLTTGPAQITRPVPTIERQLRRLA